MSGPTPSHEDVAVVTGATGGMGRVIVGELAAQGMRVVAVVRDLQRGQELRRQARTSLGEDRVEVVGADLAVRGDVVAAARSITAAHQRIAVLVNNASAHFSRRLVSVDGIELHVAVNFLAGFGLSALLTDALTNGGGRIVHVVSDSMNDTRMIRLGGHRRPVRLPPAQLDDVRQVNPESGFRPFQAYARSKLLAAMAAAELAETLAPRSVTVNLVHPGIVGTDIIDDIVPRPARPIAGLARRLALTADEGAAAALRLATDPQLNGRTGRYFDRFEERSMPALAQNPGLRRAAWRLGAAHFNL